MNETTPHMTTEAENREALWTVLHEQGRIVMEQGKGLASLTSVVEGLGGQFSLLTAAQKEAQQQNRDDHKSTMEAIQKLSEPKERPWTPYAALVVSILVIFGLVLGNMSSTTKELAKKDKELARIGSNHAKEITDLKFHEAQNALDRAAQSGQQGFDMIAKNDETMLGFLDRIITKLETVQDRQSTQAIEQAVTEQKLADLKEYDIMVGQNTDQRIMALAERLRVTEISASSNETALRATGDYLKEHTEKQGGAGHPSPNMDIRVKEQPQGAAAP